MSKNNLLETSDISLILNVQIQISLLLGNWYVGAWKQVVKQQHQQQQ